MRTFIAGVAVAVALTAGAWLALDASQISRAAMAKGDVRLNGLRPNDARPGAERSSLHIEEPSSR